MTTEGDQDPLADVDSMPGEPQGMGAISKVSSDTQVTLGDLQVTNNVRLQRRVAASGGVIG